MDRRLFFAALGGGLASGMRAGHASALESRRHTLLRSYVSSMPNVCTLCTLPTPGAALDLRVDAARAFDPRSVLVSTADREPLGYLPSTHGQIIASLLTAGFNLKAHVVDSRTLPRLAVGLEVGLVDASPLQAH